MELLAFPPLSNNARSSCKSLSTSLISSTHSSSTSNSINNSTLTSLEKELYGTSVSRISKYFQDFELVEGFTCLSSHLERLKQKIIFEIRGLFHQHSHVFEENQKLLETQRQFETKLKAQQELSQQLVQETEKMLKEFHSTQEEMRRQLRELESFHLTNEKILIKKIQLQMEEQLQQKEMELDNKKLLLEMKQKQKITEIQQKLHQNYKKEFEFYKMQLKLQKRTKMEKELQNKITTKEIEWMEKIKQKERKIEKLQQQTNKHAAIVHNIKRFE